MKMQVFGISENSTLDPLNETALSAAWQEDEVNRWIDIQDATNEELRDLLAPLNLNPAVQAACLQPHRADRVVSTQAALYLELPTHLGWDQALKPYISILCLNTTIITIHRNDSHSIEQIIRDLSFDTPLYAKTSSALLFYLLMAIGKGTVGAALEVRSEAELLDQACHEHPDNLDPKEIATLRRKVSHYSAVHDDHTYCAGILQTVESEAFRVSEQSHFYHDMLKLTQLSGQIIDGAESRVVSLARDYELVLQRRVDNRLRFLTILSAVLMPLSLISGIYGMNFNDMPAMGKPLGYLVVIGAMLGTAALTGGYLWRKGWFE
ncbi:magnesium transporter CorA family protein [Thalassoglobus polymorphus]|uniref:Magnesium transport protein CorA n=1 Tax=Thalassoglobus polymorphus TaxID=2527994 RepID=A0A517QI11_9PLAN|nr:magnesium transporter CorA family protein [Thalassoglobus polymorphus]QDT31234.1 Magnesium transport protein CorA [Thalassoglobus polymorphus]